jgi:hypothetical protein
MTYPDRNEYSGISSSLNLRFTPTITDNMDGSVEISIDSSFVTTLPSLYRVEYRKASDTSLPFTTVTSPIGVLTISGLSRGTTYTFKIRAEDGSLYGNYSIVEKYISKDSKVAGDGSKQVNGSSQTKSLLELTNTKDNFKNKKWAIVYKRFDNIPVEPEGDTETYYSYGTALYMDSNFDNPNQSAAIGFFISNQGQKGYYLSLETTSLAASANKKELRIMKATGGGNLVAIKDSQTTIAESLNGVYGGREYLVNIKVKFKRVAGVKTVNIYGSVNGYKFSATDTDYENTEEKTKNVALTPTKQVALVCKSGKVAFDYVYATDIKDKKSFDRLQLVGSIQNGIFNNDFLESGFGNLIYNQNTDEDAKIIPADAIEEFGTTVREIHTAKLKFDARPVFPINISTGLNTGASLIGSKMGSFDAELYLLNNSSTTIPIDGSSLYIYGNTLSDSGQLEYKTNETSEYVYKEPVIFETKWIQNLDDVEKLANWIKGNVINKGKIVDMEIFGNPAISIGEIITIKYPYVEMSGDSEKERFIVTNVKHEYKDGGLTTILSARKIHFSSL